MYHKENMKYLKHDRQADDDEESVQEVTFSELLDDYELEPLYKGQFVEGEILHIGENVIMADVDAKRTAVIPPQEIEKIEEDELGKLSVGDEVPLYVIRTPVGDEDLIVSLNKGMAQKDWENAREHLANGDPLELEVVGHNKGGLLVAFGRLRGFVPTSHVLQLQHVYNKEELVTRKAELVGEELLLKVIEVDRQRRRLILSAKKAQKEIRQKRLSELKQMEGEKISGRITNLVDFGAFVDLNGVEGLIHISEIAWERVEDPAEYLTEGETVDILIQSVDIDRERVSLSRKLLLPNPWDLFSQTHAEGDLVEGTVTNVVDFGAFVRVATGVEGLVHVSEIDGTQGSAAQDILYTGDRLLLRILDIEPEEQRLALSLQQVSSTEEVEWISKRQEDLLVAAGEEE